jgi:hypothetical protein
LPVARIEANSLSAPRVAANGSLQSLGKLEHSMDADKDRTAESATGEAGTILMSSLLGLLLPFLAKP